MNYEKELKEAISVANEVVKMGGKFEKGFPYEHHVPLEDENGNKYCMKIIIEKRG